MGAKAFAAGVIQIVNEGRTYGLELDMFSPQYHAAEQVAIRKRYANPGDLLPTGEFRDGGVEQAAAFRALDALRRGAAGIDLPPPPAAGVAVTRGETDRPPPRPVSQNEQDAQIQAIGDAIQVARDTLLAKDAEVTDRARAAEEELQRREAAVARYESNARAAALGDDESNLNTPGSQFAQATDPLWAFDPQQQAPSASAPPPPPSSGGGGLLSIVALVAALKWFKVL